MSLQSIANNRRITQERRVDKLERQLFAMECEMGEVQETHLETQRQLADAKKAAASLYEALEEGLVFYGLHDTLYAPKYDLTWARHGRQAIRDYVKVIPINPPAQKEQKP